MNYSMRQALLPTGDCVRLTHITSWQDKQVEDGRMHPMRRYAATSTWLAIVSDPPDLCTPPPSEVVAKMQQEYGAVKAAMHTCLASVRAAYAQRGDMGPLTELQASIVLIS